MTMNVDHDLLATVTVTFNPDIAILRSQLSQLPRDAYRVIVDNASASGILTQLRALCADHDVQLIANQANVGLATATNQGIESARKAGCGTVLLLDQDTEPGIGGVARLREAYAHAIGKGLPPGCIGPRLVDAATGLPHGFHCIRGWRWVQVFPSEGANEPIRCANLNGSGTLIPREVLDRLGGLEDSFFIDHVDTEWAFRVLDAGFGLYGAPGVVFTHRMGERTWRFWWLGWRVWPYRSPIRHRYLFRNAVQLMRRDYVPAVWKVWATLKLMLTFCVHVLLDRERIGQAVAMVRGVGDGLHAVPGHKRSVQ